VCFGTLIDVILKLGEAELRDRTSASAVDAEGGLHMDDGNKRARESEAMESF